ncbi:hypothetical protein [Citrobacter sp. CK202]|jgi:hypothetical protein|uniref:hypothetical protein n=1 Tax=Citrobacter sp. CK202 TaxID=2985111 RepID=UPI0025772337|nr:hypothetical protein [Citrobacter sp. CK202]MDM2958765.1 hNH endonuclease [Citrobacter sp. CK202]
MKSTVETKIIELVKSGHDLAKELHCAESAALISDLASQLEVQFARSNALAAKLSMINGLMDAAEQANKLAQEATEKLVQERDALAAENAGLISSSECLLHEASEVYRAYNKTQLPDGDLVDEQCLQEVYDAINATPTTDAFLAEVRAHDLNAFIQHHRAELDAHIKNGGEQLDEKSVRIRDIIVSARLFMEKLRKGGAA